MVHTSQKNLAVVLCCVKATGRACVLTLLMLL
jgi:hypothetical protein